MIEFLKNLLKQVNFKSENEELNQYNKIIYSVILLCALIFIGIIVYFIVKYWPDFIGAVKENWSNFRTLIKPQ